MISFLQIVLSSMPLVFAHMAMKEPAPRKSTYNPNYKGTPDYDKTSPLGGGFSYPCRGFPKEPSYKDYSAGQNVQVSIEGGAKHNGGHCQFALSYNGVDFVTIKTVLGTCLIDSTDYSVTIPSSAPAGEAVFAWVWNNREGNRELYMNCADITIKGGGGGALTGPELLIANFDVPGKTNHNFPEGFSNDFGKELFDAQPQISISPSQNTQQTGPNDSRPPSEPQNKPKDTPDQNTNNSDYENPKGEAPSLPKTPENIPSEGNTNNSRPKRQAPDLPGPMDDIPSGNDNSKMPEREYPTFPGAPENIPTEGSTMNNRPKRQAPSFPGPIDDIPSGNDNSYMPERKSPSFPGAPENIPNEGNAINRPGRQNPSFPGPMENKPSDNNNNYNMPNSGPPDSPKSPEMLPSEGSPKSIKPNQDISPSPKSPEMAPSGKNYSDCQTGILYCNGESSIGTCLLGQITFGLCPGGTVCVDSPSGANCSIKQ